MVDRNGNATLQGADTEHLTGTTDTIATATPKSYSGYSYAAGYDKDGNTEVASGLIAGDGSLVLKLYYVQDALKVTYVDWNDSVITTETVGYGEDATPPTDPTRPGYHFRSWDKDGKNITEDTTITAQYDPNTDTPYIVKHYLVDAFGVATPACPDEELTGTTDTTATATPKTFAGYSHDPNYPGTIAEGLIAGDGSLVLILYYTQDKLTVTYVDFDGSVITTETVGYGDDATPPADPTRPGYHFRGWDKDGKNIIENTTITAQYDPDTDTPYKTEYYWVDADGNVTLHETVPGQGTTGDTAHADVKNYTGYNYSPGYNKDGNTEVASGTIAGDGSLVLKLYYIAVEEQKESVYTVQVRYHLWTADGEVIVTDSVPGTWKPGDKVNPAGLLNAHKPYGFGNGVPVGSNWTVSGDDVTTFDIYYPDTPPVISVKNDVIYVRKPVKLTLDDIYRIADVTITDAEEDIPLSWLKEKGYANITWTVVNYPGGTGYLITLQVTDTPGLKSNYQQLFIFVLDQPEHIRKPKPGETPPSDYTPEGTAWGLDSTGDWVIYIPTKTPLVKHKQPKAKTPAGTGLGLPSTGDSALLTAPAALAAAGAAMLAATRRRRRQRHPNPSD
ncbi:MAG: InlB B-repeat-containing protein [Coriobacteriia bacterium]|nr:InlB B-repeat-containing protein [Coriobacteriia bacterium]